MNEFFQKIEITIVFYTLHLTCMQIFAAIGRFTAEIIGGGGGGGGGGGLRSPPR